MAQQPTHLAFQCVNPDCRKKVRIKIPQKSGIYPVTCPYCGIVKKLQLKGMDVFGPQTAGDTTPPPPADPQASSTHLPNNSAKAPITLNQEFLTNTTYKVACPHCNTTEIPLRSAKAGKGVITCPACKGKSLVTIKEAPQPQGTSTGKCAQPAGNAIKPPVDLGDDFYVNTAYTIKCPHCKDAEIQIKQENVGPGLIVCPKCKGRVRITARKPTETIAKSELIQRFRGKLILLRRGWLNKDYPLHDGKNTVGRYDEYEPSDISIKGDAGISRRSIEILVDHHDKGYSFKLTVKKATNPVLHNNKPLAVNDSISLNFGDSIIMGKTKFRFDKDV